MQRVPDGPIDANAAGPPVMNVLELTLPIRTFVFFRCETCGHEQHHWVPAYDCTHVRKCAECGKMAAVARSAP